MVSVHSNHMGKRILIVDDEQSLLELVSAILDEEGFEVETTLNGKEALDKLKSAKPDLVILDMMMPGMSGRETAERIRNDPTTKDIPIIFLTVAKFSEAGKDILKKLGIKDYITKPFENDDLVKRVKKVLS